MCRELHVHQYDGTRGVRSTEKWIEGVSTDGKQKVARILKVATLVQLFVLCTVCKAKLMSTFTSSYTSSFTSSFTGSITSILLCTQLKCLGLQY